MARSLFHFFKKYDPFDLLYFIHCMTSEKSLCNLFFKRAFTRRKGRNNVTVDDLVHVITPKGRGGYISVYVSIFHNERTGCFLGACGHLQFSCWCFCCESYILCSWNWLSLGICPLIGVFFWPKIIGSNITSTWIFPLGGWGNCMSEIA